MKQLNNEQIHGVVGTIVVHIILLLILLFVVIEKPVPQEEEGVPVVMGNIERAKGDAYAPDPARAFPSYRYEYRQLLPVRS